MELKSGDIVLFSGRFEPHLKVQKLSGNKWSQVGIIILWNNNIAILESTKAPICKDVDGCEDLSGVQIVYFKEKFDLFNGSIAVRKLLPEIDDQKSRDLLTFAKLVKGKPFNDNKYFMVRGFHRKNPISDNSCFICSQLVAEALQHIEVLQRPPFGLFSSNYSPIDFTEGTDLDLSKGYNYSKELILKM